MNRNLIITLFLTNIAAHTMAMDNGSDPKITALLRSVYMLNYDSPISEEYLLAKNPSWLAARSWSQEDKNKLLSGAMSVRQFQDTDTRIPLAVAIGADPNYDAHEEGEISKHTWTTPLTRASRFSNYWLVQYLLEKKADPNQVSRPVGLCPLQCASTPKIAKLLLAKGATIPKAFLQTLYPDAPAELMEFYLEMGVRPEQNELGESPLHAITPFFIRWMEGRFGKAQMLIKAGVDLCAQTKDSELTVLHCVALGKDGMRRNYLQTEDLDINKQIGSAIIKGCRERHQRYQGRFTLLCCLQRLYPSSLYTTLKDVRKKYFPLLRTDNISPFQLLSIENCDGKTPYQLWPENEELNPEKYRPVQSAKKE